MANVAIHLAILCKRVAGHAVARASLSLRPGRRGPSARGTGNRQRRRGRRPVVRPIARPAAGASLRAAANMLSVAHEPGTDRDRQISRHSAACDAARFGNIDHHHRPDRRHGRGGSRLQDRIRGPRFHFLPAQGCLRAGCLRPLRPVLPQPRHRLVLGRAAAARHPAPREMGRCQRPHQARPHQPACAGRGMAMRR